MFTVRNVQNLKMTTILDALNMDAKTLVSLLKRNEKIITFIISHICCPGIPGPVW